MPGANSERTGDSIKMALYLTCGCEWAGGGPAHTDLPPISIVSRRLPYIAAGEYELRVVELTYTLPRRAEFNYTQPSALVPRSSG